MNEYHYIDDQGNLYTVYDQIALLQYAIAKKNHLKPSVKLEEHVQEIASKARPNIAKELKRRRMFYSR